MAAQSIKGSERVCAAERLLFDYKWSDSGREQEHDGLRNALALFRHNMHTCAQNLGQAAEAEQVKVQLQRSSALDAGVGTSAAIIEAVSEPLARPDLHNRTSPERLPYW